ncbi:MAG: hypothetical protein ACRDH9_03665 [Actinomycetota bacterium]
MQTEPDGLLPFTKLVLGISATVQLLFGVVGLLFLDFWNDVLWSDPLPPWPEPVARFAFLNYLATGIAAVFALRQGRWTGAKVYFAFSFPYIVLSVLAVIVTAIDVGVPAIMWGYVGLSVIYLPAVVYAWAKQLSR